MSEAVMRTSHETRTFVDVLRDHANTKPDKKVFTFLANGVTEVDSYTFGQLDRRARAIGAVLQQMGASGERALLLFHPGLDFVVAFMGCLYAGVTAVPAYPPKMNRNALRLQSILVDCKPAVTITTSQIMERVKARQDQLPELQLPWVNIDEIEDRLADDWRESLVTLDTLAFLQYTSGSTGTPKGAMVSHGNLIHNERMIREAFQQDEHSKVLGWLPLYHDMGLIGTVLQPLYLGASCVLMSPVDFLQNPFHWLKGISDYQITTSGGPNFAYDLCVRKITDEQCAQLDLRSWTVAFNGAEPVRSETLQRFSEKFASSGFQKKAFYPCYGLAESTLFVTGGYQQSEPVLQTISAKALLHNRVEAVEAGTEDSQTLVGSGHVWLDHQVRVVNPETETECAQDQIGEIWVAGPSLAKGYWNLPDVTAATFGARLADAQEGPFLRTGDLGFLRDGELYVTGRLKDMIIIRGRNHYPQDIEVTVGNSHDALNPGMCAAFSVDVQGEERLVIVQEVERAHWRSVQVEEVSEAIRRDVAEHHELQVHAVVIIKPGSIPKTSSGKIQRHACRNAFLAGALDVLGDSILGGDTSFEGEEQVQLTRAELLAADEERREELLHRYLSNRASQILRIGNRPFSKSQSFSAIGMDSLMAVELKHTVETDLGIHLSAVDLLQDATVDKLTGQLIEKLKTGDSSSMLLRTTQRADGSERSLSYGQQALWFSYRLEPTSTIYHIPLAVRIRSKISVDALRLAFDELVKRHPILRTTYAEHKGQPVQTVHDALPHVFEVNDATEATHESLHAKLIELSQRPFLLESEASLRIYLLKCRAEEHVLLVTFHHIAVDLWSITKLMGEWRDLYTAAVKGTQVELAAPVGHYADFVDWQKEMLASEQGESLWSYWQEQLKDVPHHLELPTRGPRPAVQEYRCGSHHFGLDASLTQRIKELSNREGVTLYTTLLAVYQVLLHRYTEQKDFLVGSPVAGRDSALMHDVVGYFVNSIVLRATFDDTTTFRHLLKRTKQTVLGALKHQAYPFPLLVERLGVERNSSMHPLFQTMFVLQNPHLLEEMTGFVAGDGGAQEEFAGLLLESIALRQNMAQFDLTLSMVETREGLRASLQYNADLFDEAMIKRMATHFSTLVAGVVEQADQLVARLPILTAPERELVMKEWSHAPEVPLTGSIPELFEAQAAATSDQIALVFGEQRLTYERLNRRANQVAHVLRAQGIGPEVVVGLCVERSIEMIVAILAIMKAGATYVTLDVNLPTERIKYLIEDSGAVSIVTLAHLQERLHLEEMESICLDREQERIDQASEANLPTSTTLDSLVHIIYTSGSTGLPKGVLVTHRGVVRLAKGLEFLEVSSDDVFLQFCPISFDVSTFEIFNSLLNGACLAIFPPHVPSLQELGRFIRKQGITILWLTAGLFHQIVDHQLEDLRGVRLFLAGGDVLSVSHVKRVLQELDGCTMVNGYGPTENTTFTSCHVMKQVEDVGFTVSIGTPISGTYAYVLDENLQPVPIGVVGELYAGGDGVAAGYWNRPELTAERFVVDPYAASTQARMYKTGDRARFLEDGTLEYLGRNDTQVKLRGFRIEVGEIEKNLLSIQNVQSAAVVVREDVPGDKRLVAYVVAEPGDGIEVSELRIHLKDMLPDYMIPSAFVQLDELPLNTNGKVDRKALPKPADDNLAWTAGYVAPRTPLEAQVANIFRDVLRCEVIGVHDSFFDLGGHSLLATQLISRVREVLGVDLPMRSLFEAPTVAELALCIEQERGQVSLGRIERRDQTLEEALPMSYAQTRMWYLDQLLPGNPLYNVPVAVRLQGTLHREALTLSLKEIVTRHEALRTTFAEVDGAAVPRLLEAVRVDVAEIDLSHLTGDAREELVIQTATDEAKRPFDMAEGPLLRASLLRLQADEHVLLLTMHHIVSDGWSMQVFVRELAACYEAFAVGAVANLPELPIQYADYAVWQKELLESGVLERELSYWQTQLGGRLPVLQLPTDRPRPKTQSYRGSIRRFALAPELSERVTELSRQEGTTLYMTLLAAFNILLYRYSGQDDLAVGTPIANRDRRELEDLIGYIANTLVLRTDLSGDPNFRDLLGRVREVCLQAYAHQHVPFEKLVEVLQPERNMSHTALFQVMFVMQNAYSLSMSLPGVEMSLLDVDRGVSKFDLLLSMAEQDGVLSGTLEYSTDLFDAETVDRMLGHFTRILECVTSEPEQTISRLPLLTAKERERMLVTWNDTAYEHAFTGCFQHVFESVAAQHPDAIALIGLDQKLTYRQLNERANQVAHHLQTLGIVPDQRVGLYLERSVEQVIGLLGILKAGGAYVPIDASYPTERIRYMLEDSQVPVVLTERKLLDSLTGVAIIAVCLDADGEVIAGHPTTNTVSETKPEHSAYMIYTSGSTGRPKGVLIEHRSLLNLSAALQQAVYADETMPQLRVTLNASLAFDSSVKQLQMLLHGHALCIVPEDTRRDMAEMLKFLQQTEINVLDCTPSQLRVLLEEGLLEAETALRRVLVGGEAIDEKLWQQLRTSRKIRFFNVYGPSECTVNATVCPIDERQERPSLGRPIANVQVYVLDTQLQPVPVGVIGELHIGGRGVGRGYHDRIELNATRFVEDPFATEAGARLYRTGDLVRYRPDGSLEFLGRIDHQVKIRGFRIEIGEIEVELKEHQSVREAVVTVHADGDRQALVAYVVAKEGIEADVQTLRHDLKKRLPDYMVPNAFVILDEMPLNTNGKVDRHKLPVPHELTANVGVAYVAPRTPVEENLVDIWSEVLRVQKIGVHDNFFDLGGYSLLATQVASRVRKVYEVEVPVRLLFESPTIEGMANYIEEVIWAEIEALDDDETQQLLDEV